MGTFWECWECTAGLNVDEKHEVKFEYRPARCYEREIRQLQAEIDGLRNDLRRAVGYEQEDAR